MPPAVQRVLLHRGDEKAPVGRDGRRRDASPSIRAGSARPRRWGTTATRRCNGRARADSPWAGRQRPRTVVGAVQVFTAPAASRARACLPGRPGDRAVARRERVDPAALLVGDRLERRRRREVATTRPSSPPVTQPRRRRAPRRGSRRRDGRRRAARAGLADQHGAVGERQRRLAAEECRGDDMRARRRAAATCCGQR